jgi:thiamine biosynthesis lipoprotein
VSLDLGSTAKAFAADRAAADIARTLACGVLVNLGGDIAVAGDPPQGGWLVRVCEEHDAPQDAPGPLMSITSGGVATSSIVRRTWRQGDRDVHHIVDPRTGDLPEPVWRTVTVAAATCVDANTASTAAVVLAGTAQAWLEQRGLPARLVGIDGDVTTVTGWPPDSQGELG